MKIMFALYVVTSTLLNKPAWEKMYHHMMEFLINVHILKNIDVLEVPL
jgi:hypothetical protein